MTIDRTNAWRMRVLLSILDRPGRTSIRHGLEGDRFVCHSHHMVGGGLLEIRHSRTQVSATRVIRVDKYGRAIGIFDVDADGSDNLVYDRDSGFGDSDEAELDVIRTLEKLESSITPQEQQQFFG